jgi:predicted RNA binding protein YcfA (HicA-like mRNA interferase family)
MANSLPCVTGQEAIRAFKKLGFTVDRIRSSHHIMKRDGHLYVLTVPVHGSDDIKPGTLRSLIRAAGISVDEFCELLS